MDNAGHTVVAWDDQRDGSPELCFSSYLASGWSDNDNPGAASGKGAQTHPAMVIGPQGSAAGVSRSPGQADADSIFLGNTVSGDVLSLPTIG